MAPKTAAKPAAKAAPAKATPAAKTTPAPAPKGKGAAPAAATKQPAQGAGQTQQQAAPTGKGGAFGVYVKGLDAYGLNHDTIRSAFGNAGPISEIRLRGGKYAILFFQTQAGQKKALDLNGKNVLGKKITVEAAKAKPTRDRAEYATTVFVGHLPGAVTKDRVKQHFARFGNVIKVRVYDQKHVGFVYFDSNESAKKALKLDEPLLNHKLDVKLSVRTKTPAQQGGKTKSKGGQSGATTAAPAKQTTAKQTPAAPAKSTPAAPAKTTPAAPAKQAAPAAKQAPAKATPPAKQGGKK